MFEKLLSYHQIEDLRRDHILNKFSTTDYDRRANFAIAVIDDRPFPYEQNLKANGYLIETLGDIKSIDEVSRFNIVLCDLQGVGKLLNQTGQGAFIIDEVKRKNPEKFVVAYTGGSPDDAITIKAQEHADFFLKKDQDIDDWRDRLDYITGQLSNPIEIWRRQRDALVDADVPTLDILKLEDAYVKSVKNENISPYRAIATSNAVSKDLRGIAQSLIASGIFKALFG
ncbi:MAG: hypothetical protein ABGW87_02105 [Sphingomonadaceae bacterium]